MVFQSASCPADTQQSEAFVEMLGRMRNSFIGGKEFMEAVDDLALGALQVNPGGITGARPCGISCWTRPGVRTGGWNL